DVNITAGVLSIIANLLAPNGLHAFAQGSVGGFVGLVSSDAEATDNATVTSGITNRSGNGSATGAAVGTLHAVSGALSIVANSNTEQSANSQNASVGFVAKGAGNATATANN